MGEEKKLSEYFVAWKISTRVRESDRVIKVCVMASQSGRMIAHSRVLHKDLRWQGGGRGGGGGDALA